MEEFLAVQRILVWLIPISLAIILHETAHGWAAKSLGDPTAHMLGRLSLNPIRHIDPIGTLLLPAIMYWQFGFMFGWAKPVPVVWSNLHNPKRDMAVVAVAGPVANLLMAIAWGVITQAGMVLANQTEWLGSMLVSMGKIGIIINMFLMILNLFPIPPLDGGRIAVSFLPHVWAARLAKMEPYGMFIAIALVAMLMFYWQRFPWEFINFQQHLFTLFGV